MDFDETFTPVIKPTLIRVILYIAVINKWMILQLDVKNFLHGHLKEVVYIEKHPDFTNPVFPNHVCQLKRALMV